jgi:N-hydroxyarylamine O-acetyltransferase
MTASVDLDAYFERIGWAGETAPTFATLAGLLRAHMSRIPFENLDVLLGRPVRLDLDALQSKLVLGQRGGYCFEHATLFGAALEKLGFRVARHLARGLVLAPRTVAARLHMFLTVAVERSDFVLDPGFGGLAPRVPVPLRDGAHARAGHEVHWMARDGAHWRMCTQAGDKTIDLWISAMDEDNPLDFEVANHYTASHPASPFVNRLMMRALTSDGQVRVMNRDVTVWRANEPESTTLADRRALRALLATHFGFDLPEAERLRVPLVPEWNDG